MRTVRGAAPASPGGRLVGDDLRIPVAGELRRYVDLDAAATTPASEAVLRAVQDFLPWYSSVHRGAGAKSQYSTARYEQAQETTTGFVGADPATHVAHVDPARPAWRTRPGKKSSWQMIVASRPWGVSTVGTTPGPASCPSPGVGLDFW
jgi:hypothetical protein